MSDQHVILDTARSHGWGVEDGQRSADPIRLTRGMHSALVNFNAKGQLKYFTQDGHKVSVRKRAVLLAYLTQKPTAAEMHR